MKIAIIVTALCLVLVTAASATIPGIISYQGLLRDAGGNVVPNGNYSLTFRLYTAASGGSAIWTETQTLAVADGVFNAQLGSVTTFGALGFDVPYWLGVQIGGGAELSPRVQFAASPYAKMAGHIEPNVVGSLDGVTNDEGNIDLVAGANVTITPNDVANTITIAATGGGGGIGGSGTLDYIPKFTAATTLGSSTMYETATGFVVGNVSADVVNSALKNGDDGLDRQANRFRVVNTDGKAIAAIQYNTDGVDNEAAVYGYRSSSNAGTSYAYGNTNAGVLGYDYFGDAFTFGVSGYSFGDYNNTGGVFGADYTGSVWGSLGYKDTGDRWWGLYTEDDAHVGGLQLPTGAGAGKVLTSDAGGTATWQTQTEIMDYHNEGATTVILPTPTTYDDCNVALSVPGPGFITVTASVWVRVNHTAGTTDVVALNISASPGAMGEVYSRAVSTIPGAIPTTGQVDVGKTVTSVIPVTSAGTFTYYLVGQMTSGYDASDTFWYAQMSGIFHPASLTAVQSAIAAQETLHEKMEPAVR